MEYDVRGCYGAVLAYLHEVIGYSSKSSRSSFSNGHGLHHHN